jgi:hypothetical protein
VENSTKSTIFGTGAKMRLEGFLAGESPPCLFICKFHDVVFLSGVIFSLKRFENT